MLQRAWLFFRTFTRNCLSCPKTLSAAPVQLLCALFGTDRRFIWRVVVLSIAFAFCLLDRRVFFLTYWKSVFLWAETVLFGALLALFLRACHCLGFRLFDGAFIWRFAWFFLTFLSFGGCVERTLLLQDLVPFAAFQVLLFLLEIREEAIQDRLALLERLCLV